MNAVLKIRTHAMAGSLEIHIWNETDCDLVPTGQTSLSSGTWVTSPPDIIYPMSGPGISMTCELEGTETELAGQLCYKNMPKPGMFSFEFTFSWQVVPGSPGSYQANITSPYPGVFSIRSRDGGSTGDNASVIVVIAPSP